MKRVQILVQEVTEVLTQTVKVNPRMKMVRKTTTAKHDILATGII